ncbi:hypothetical protein [Zooshikella sp. RANM57]|uniref:hypothetical protein n=1 Tax=Zooshikella sp. RANM57 TaxID=3425863 RepID=UPI003D6DF12E
MAFKRLSIIFCIVFFLTGCDHFFYPPTIRNDFDTSIEIKVKYSTGKQLSHIWTPCLSGPIGAGNDIAVEEIHGTKNGKTLFILDKEKIKKMVELESNNENGYSVWGIGPDGVNFYTEKKECFQDAGN